MPEIKEHIYDGSRPCVFRGAEKRKQTRVTNRFEIFQCRVHGQCAVVDPDFLKETAVPIHSCLDCDSRIESPMKMLDAPTIKDPGEGKWVFRNYSQFMSDVLQMTARLPDIRAVAGVPRSGLFPASIISTQLGIPIIPLESLVSGSVSHWRPEMSKPIQKKGGSILVVDDTSWSGRSILHTKSSINRSILDECVFGAVYAGQDAVSSAAIDLAGFVMPTLRHCFSWNYLRDIYCGRTLSDLDGVFCSDWPGHADDGSDSYRTWLTSVKPITRPAYQLLGIVTGRVRTFEKETVEWLNKNGIIHKNLHILFDDVVSRTGKDVGARKAEVYQSYQQAELFVESSKLQADIIFSRTGRPVLCTETQEIIQ